MVRPLHDAPGSATLNVLRRVNSVPYRAPRQRICRKAIEFYK
jgi:hypothetical protein